MFRDFGDPDADVKQTKGILDDRNLSTRKAQALTGIDQAEFVRIRNAKLDRFTIDRLMTIINKLDHHVDIPVEVRPATAQARCSGDREAGVAAGARAPAPVPS